MSLRQWSLHCQKTTCRGYDWTWDYTAWQPGIKNNIAVRLIYDPIWWILTPRLSCLSWFCSGRWDSYEVWVNHVRESYPLLTVGAAAVSFGFHVWILTCPEQPEISCIVVGAFCIASHASVGVNFAVYQLLLREVDIGLSLAEVIVLWLQDCSETPTRALVANPSDEQSFN